MAKVLTGAGACALALIAVAPACAQPLAATVPAGTRAPGAMAQLRAENAALRERMGRLQLDLLIADVLAERRGMPGGVRRVAGAPTAAQVAFRR